MRFKPKNLKNKQISKLGLSSPLCFLSILNYKSDVINQISMEGKVQPLEEVLTQKIQEVNQPPKLRTYLKRKLVGSGGFAKCYEGIDQQSGKQIAIKRILKQTLLKNRAKQRLLSEIKIHKMLMHPHIVRFLSVFEDATKVYIIVEYCQNGNLRDFVKKRKRLSIIEVKRFMNQLIEAMEYMHKMRVIHRDLKLANILLDDQFNLKIADLGLAAKLEFSDQKRRTMCGTPNYIAPEIISGQVGHSYEVDLWSAGIICYVLFYGNPPFETTEVKRTYERIKLGIFQFPEIEGLTLEFKDFVKRLLKVDPKQRMTIEQMKNHPFMAGQVPKLTYNKLTLTPVYDNRLQILKTIMPEEINPFKDQDSKDKNTGASTMKQQLQGDSSKQNSWNYTGVLCYVDYSTKYGLGYILSNTTYGVYFNDSSLLYHNHSQNIYFYSENPSLNDGSSIKERSLDQLTTNSGLNKKYLLLKKFKQYLDDEQTKCKQKPNIQQSTATGQIWIRQWLKTKHAIMFRLTNKIFQVDFFDGSRVCLKTDSKQILLRSKVGEIRATTLESALSEKNTETSRRIKYIKEILNSLKK